MTAERVVQLLKIEKECILRNENSQCDRDCASCDLLQTTSDLTLAYDTAIDLIEQYIKWGGTYAKEN